MGADELEKDLAPLQAAFWEREGFLAQARLLLVLVCIVTVSLKRELLGANADISSRLILLYFAYSVANSVLALSGWHYGTVSTVLLHAVDIVVVSLITVLTGGTRSIFTGLFLLVLLASAGKRGIGGALLTSCASALSILTLGALFGNQLLGSLVLASGLLCSGCLLGLFVERERVRAADELLISRFVRVSINEASFKDALAGILRLLREYFDADQVRLALQELKGDEAVAWDIVRGPKEGEDAVRSWRLTESMRLGSFAMPSDDSGQLQGLRTNGEKRRPEQGAQRKLRSPAKSLVSGRIGSITSRAKRLDKAEGLRIVCEEHTPFGSSWSLLATSFTFEEKWLGRLTLYNPCRDRSRRSSLRLLEALVREVGPVLLNKFNVGRIRTRAQARERLRLVQELHDGIVQSLIGLEMQLEHLRRSEASSPSPSAILEKLCRFQAHLHGEIAAVREEMQRIRPLQVEPNRLVDHIARTVDRFERDQGISARFIAEVDEIALPSRVCTEIVRIVQEALVNVRKHSGARKVLVSFGRQNGHYRLFVQDDGCGFGFTGSLASGELDAWVKCPAIVRERVHAIGGELMIESTEPSGARLEILVPVTANGRISRES